MKTITKILLPISTMVATTSIVAPCLTSCDNGDIWKNAIDLSTYQPTLPRHQHESSFTDIQAANALFDDANAQNNIKQDILCYLQNSATGAIIALLATLGFYTLPEYITSELCSISNVSIQHQEGEQTGRLSGTIRLKFECDMYKDLEFSKKMGTYTLETEHILHNLPYFVSWHENTQWGTNCNASGDLSLLKDDKTWYVDRSYSGVANYDNPEIFDEHEVHSIRYTFINIESIAKDETQANLFKLVYWNHSYYLSDCVHG